MRRFDAVARLRDLHKRFQDLRPEDSRLDLSGRAANVNGEHWRLVGEDRWELVASKPPKRNKGVSF